MKQKKSLLGVKLTGGLGEEMTAWAGTSLLIEIGRKCGAMETAERVLPPKKSVKGLTQGQMVESFVLLSAVGGECIDDMEQLRWDKGLAAMLGYTPPASETARQWLDKFHDEYLVVGRPLQGSFLPPESKPLAGLREVNRREIWAYVEAARPGWEVTFDIDAHLAETSKEDARYCYKGHKAFQPAVVTWAETGLVMVDEFREGNVPASKGAIRLVDEAYDMLLSGRWQVRIRSDSAAYEQKNLDHWHNRGWEFAVSADMSPQLRQEIEALPEDAWKVWKEEKRGVVREWAEVAYVPGRKYEKKDAQSYRYLAIRVRRQQGELFEEGVKVRHYAMVSNNCDMDGQALLEWQRGKAGAIEHIHHILNNELAGGVYPSARHGANAAWLRLQVLTHNLFQLLKAVALPQEYATARPKRLRFAIFTQFGRIVRHAGQVLLRLANEAWKALIEPGRRRIEAVRWDTS
ncbi:MAG: hypothetical protein DDT33_00697 [Firmicutes bacterium]|nr:hypothetical protein [Bacillota bacterium]